MATTRLFSQQTTNNKMYKLRGSAIEQKQQNSIKILAITLLLFIVALGTSCKSCDCPAYSQHAPIETENQS